MTARSTALAIALLLLTAVPARGQASAGADPGRGTTVEFPEGSWAITVCVTRPLTWYNDEMPDSVRASVEVHEAAHRAHMATFLSCWDYRNWLRESAYHPIDAEARAYCAGARHDHLTGARETLAAAVEAHAALFAARIGLTPEGARAAMREHCPI